MPMGTQLLLGFLSIVALMTVAGWITIRQQSVIQESFVILESADDVERFLLECRRQEKNYLLRMDQASLDLFTADFDSLLHVTAGLQEIAVRPEIGVKIPGLREKVLEYGDAFRDTRTIWPSGAAEERTRLESTMVARARSCHAIVAEIRGMAISNFGDAHRMTRHVSLIAIALGLLFSVLIAGVLTRHIAGPLGRLRRLAERVSTGDIQDMDVEFTELDTRNFGTRESYELARSLQRMVTNLRLLVSSERGLMDDYHMTIVVLVNKAVGPGGWALIEEAQAAAGFASFTDVRPVDIENFLIELGKRAIMLIPKERVDLLCDAIRKLGT